MNRILFVIFFNVIAISQTFADIPFFDIITIRHDTATFYMKMESFGTYNPIDSCYYDYNGKNLGKYKEFIIQWLHNESIGDFFKELHTIDTRKIAELLEYWPDTCYVLKNRVRVNVQVVLSDFELIHVERGNIYGYIFSEPISTADNTWITSRPLELLFSIEFQGCHMHLIAITGQVSEQEQVALQELIAAILKNEYWETYQALLNELYGRNILMVGFCSC
jgi:hypothetical protein